MLRPVTEDDVDAMLAVRNAPAVIATTNTKEPLPRERLAGQVERRVATWRERRFGSWLIIRDGRTIGFVEVHPIGEESGVDPDELELGVVLHPDQWGQGIALEAGAAVARDLFDRVGRQRVYAEVEETNDKSLRLVAKVPGARHLGGELYELARTALGSLP